jgi:hypothetical protein
MRRRRAADDRVVAAFLAETDLSDDFALRRTLDDVRALGAGPMPEPSAAVAKLISAPTASAEEQRIRNRRVFIAALAVAATVGIGATAAVASSDFRDSAQKVITGFIHPAQPTPKPTHTPVATHTPASSTTSAPTSHTPGSHPTHIPGPGATGQPPFYGGKGGGPGSHGGGGFGNGNGHRPPGAP